ncbi:hypothetical protein IGI37_003724 [Enterococcus sp. AZ194]|uniref:MmcQ/YjbR family DNA-binding protein n=1 Tax=Enterococcus sp. AZ194 TaxID=2774629 RepID=UPI003F23A28B
MREINTYLLKVIEDWAGATVRYREDWEVYYFSVAQKCFALHGIDNEKGAQLIVKGRPEENEVLREMYEFVVPGYHMNKTHWNSIFLDKSSFSEEEVEKLLKRSYDLVVSKLTKSQRNSLDD